MFKYQLLMGVFSLSVCLAPVYGEGEKSAATSNETVAKQDTLPAADHTTHPAPTASAINVRRKVELLDFLQRAYETNPGIISAHYGRNAKDAELLSALGRFAPNVRLSVGTESKVSSPTPFAPTNTQKSLADTIEKVGDIDYNLQGSVNARLNLFRFGSDSLGVMGASAAQEGYDVEHSDAIQKFLLEAVEAYVNVIKSRQALDVYNKFERQARHNYERVQTEYVVGSSTRTNVLTAKAELAQATSNRMKAQTELVNAEQFYISLSGEPAGDLSYPKNVVKLPVSFDEALKIAEEKNLNLRKGAANLRSARYKLASTVTGTLPSIDLTVNYGRSLNDTDAHKGGDGSVGIGLSYELFSNSSHIAQIKQGVETQKSASYGYEQSKSVMLREIKAAWHGLKTAESQRVQAELALEAARTAYEGAVEEFRLGQRAYLDLLKVQENLLKVELSFLEGTKADILGRYKLLAAMGTLTPSAIGLTVTDFDEQEENE